MSIETVAPEAEHRTWRFSAPRGPEATGHLEFPRGAARVSIRAAGMPDLFHANFWGAPPNVAVVDGRVIARYPRISPRHWLAPWARRGGEVMLNRDVIWDLLIQGGVAHLDADLRDIRLRAIELGRGASHTVIRLGRPSGAVPIHIRGGASGVTVSRPKGVAARLRIGSGVSDVTFDEQEFGAVGGGLRLSTTDAGGSEDLYDIEISGGASRVRVTSYEMRRKDSYA